MCMCAQKSPSRELQCHFLDNHPPCAPLSPHPSFLVPSPACHPVALALNSHGRQCWRLRSPIAHSRQSTRCGPHSDSMLLLHFRCCCSCCCCAAARIHPNLMPSSPSPHSLPHACRPTDSQDACRHVLRAGLWVFMPPTACGWRAAVGRPAGSCPAAPAPAAKAAAVCVCVCVIACFAGALMNGGMGCCRAHAWVCVACTRPLVLAVGFDCIPLFSVCPACALSVLLALSLRWGSVQDGASPAATRLTLMEVDDSLLLANEASVRHRASCACASRLFFLNDCFDAHTHRHIHTHTCTHTCKFIHSFFFLSIHCLALLRRRGRLCQRF